MNVRLRTAPQKGDGSPAARTTNGVHHQSPIRGIKRMMVVPNNDDGANFRCRIVQCLKWMAAVVIVLYLCLVVVIFGGQPEQSHNIAPPLDQGLSDRQRKIQSLSHHPINNLQAQTEENTQQQREETQPLALLKGHANREYDTPDMPGQPNVGDGCGSSERDEDLKIQLHVLGWRRAGPLGSLLHQLNSANYRGWHEDLPLRVHLDGGASGDVVAVATDFRWSHGMKTLDVREQNVGLREMWLSSLGNAAREAGENTLMIVFEDDTSVSPSYFQWIIAVVDAYARNRKCRDANLMGYSLSPMRVNDLDPKGVFPRWNAGTEIGYDRVAYLTTVPSSWGGAYWSDRWREFDEFVKVRMQPEYFSLEEEAKFNGKNYDDLQLSPRELWVPDSRHNVWPKSWKRFMVDWMFGRGLFMVRKKQHCG